jgi:hypothetical protein
MRAIFTVRATSLVTFVGIARFVARRARDEGVEALARQLLLGVEVPEVFVTPPALLVVHARERERRL